MITSLLEYIVKTLVDKPEFVVITETREENRLVFGVKVGEDDLGRVIGKDGQTIRAIRSLALVVAPAGIDVVVDVIK